MRVKVVAHLVIGGRSYVPGDVVEMSDDLAQELVSKRQAFMILGELTPPSDEPQPTKRKRSK